MRPSKWSNEQRFLATIIFAGKGISGQSDPIRVNEAIETMVITVTEADGNTVAYVVSLLKERQIAVSEDGIVDTDSIVDEGSTITLNGVFVGGSGNYRYQWAITADEPLMLSSTSTALPSFYYPRRLHKIGYCHDH